MYKPERQSHIVSHDGRFELFFGNLDGDPVVDIFEHHEFVDGKSKLRPLLHLDEETFREMACLFSNGTMALDGEVGPGCGGCHEADPEEAAPPEVKSALDAVGGASKAKAKKVVH